MDYVSKQLASNMRVSHEELTMCSNLTMWDEDTK